MRVIETRSAIHDGAATIEIAHDDMAGRDDGRIENMLLIPIVVTRTRKMSAIMRCRGPIPLDPAARGEWELRLEARLGAVRNPTVRRLAAV